MIVPLESCLDESALGGKAVQLGTAIRAGLPVPGGFALAWPDADAVASGDMAALASALARLGATTVAVRSSAVGEDSRSASFAGVHATRLAVRGLGAIADAVREVVASGSSDSALAYRAASGAREVAPRVGVVVQRFLDADVAGVLFTRHPVTGADERVIEAAWGLGEAVVGGLVTPDHWRIARDGGLVEERLGEKDVAIRVAPEGGTHEVRVDAARAGSPCLTRDELARVAALAADCERVFGEGLDIEWCLFDGRVHLLQVRPLTA